ncbi:hypothetical protein Tco_0450500 [Tanacetum coccineum]
MLKRCEDTNLSLNWEKSHFMVKEGIVLGHKISKSGLEVDRAKVEVIRPLCSGQEALDISQKLATVDPTGDTNGANYTQEKSLISGIIGPPSTRMPMTLSPLRHLSNVKGKLRNGMRCHKKLHPSFRKSLTSGHDLWGPFPVFKGTSTYSWRLTTC